MPMTVVVEQYGREISTASPSMPSLSRQIGAFTRKARVAMTTVWAA
jgi:hypothetical protein